MITETVLPKHTPLVEYVHPAIRIGIMVCGFAFIPIGLFIDMDLGALFGLVFGSASIGLGSYIRAKRDKEANSIRLKPQRSISRFLQKGGLIGLSLLPWMIGLGSDTRWDFMEMLLYTDAPLMGWGVLLNQKGRYLILYEDALEYSYQGKSFLAHWDKVYRVEIWPERFKVFYDEDSFIVTDFDWFSKEDLDFVLSRLNIEVENNRIHTLKKTKSGEVDSELYASNARVKIWS